MAPATGCARQSEAPARPMNILYIMTDDHTAQMMSCYDTRYASTPNLDRIAVEGVRFTNSFVANSLSGPSRACMLTGKHSHKNGFYDNTTCVFDNAQQTFPKLLQQAGYETAVVGKWHLESLPTGFDHWEIVPGQGDYYNPDFIRQTGDTVRSEGYITNLITDKSLDWLRSGRGPGVSECTDGADYLFPAVVRRLRDAGRRHLQLYLCGIHHLRLRPVHSCLHHDSDAGTAVPGCLCHPAS